MADCVRLGLVAPPGFAAEIADEIAPSLPNLLEERVGGDIRWDVPVSNDARDGDGLAAAAMVDAAREQMLQQGWDLAISLTEVPVRAGRRPVIADASATHGVGLISLPALGPRHVAQRTCDAIVRLVDGLVGERMAGGAGGAGRRGRVRGRLQELVAPERTARQDSGHVRMVAGAVGGHLRLIGGMIRANRPWRLAAHMSRALAAAAGTVAIALANSNIWQLSDRLPPTRLAVMTAVSLIALALWLIMGHDLWERPQTNRQREQAVLFNTATAVTVAIGVVVFYACMLAAAAGGAALVIERHVFSRAIHHQAGTTQLLKLAWMASSVAVVGGALGSGFESDDAVREAAYGYHPDRESEHEQDA